MSNKTHKICFGTDINCPVIRIEWLSGHDGLLVPCEQDNCIEVQIDPFYTGLERCIEGFIICENADGSPSCSNCAPVYFKRCFCDEEGNGCGPEQICDDGICVGGCSETEFAQGKIYDPTGCKCPPDKPIEDTGRTGFPCAQCITGSVHPDNPCLVCVKGEWVAKNCGDGNICDETDNGNCRPDCSLNTDGRTRYNYVTKQCDCVRGYVWNGIECVEAPKTCDPGQEWNPVTRKCEDIDCGPGLEYSAEVDDCIPEGCSETPCDNGTDCSQPGCGCPETIKKCSDCKQYPNAPGCGSPDHDPPKGCDTGIQCDPDYGCFEGECEHCSNFTPEQAKSIPGCENYYNPENELGCLDTHSLKKKDCATPLTSTLNKVGTCQCEMLGTSFKILSITNDGVEDKETYTGTFEADIRKAYADNESAYALKPLFTNEVINNERPISVNVTMIVTPRYLDIHAFNQGSAGAYFDGNDIIETIDLSENAVSTTIAQFDPITIGSNNIVRDVNGKAISGTQLVGYKLKVTISDVDFYNNCSYTGKTLYASSSIFSIATNTVPTYVTIAKLKSTSSKNPLLTWKRNGEVFRKFYVQKDTNGVFNDTLYGPQKFANNTERGQQILSTPQGELLPNSTYTSTWDCTCDPEKTYKNFIICDVEFEKDTHFKVQASSISSSVCNNQIEIIDDFDVCDLNKNLLDYGWDSITAAQYQTKYILKLNGTAVATFVYSNSVEGLVEEVNGVLGNKTFIGYKKSLTETITSVSLEMNHSSGCKKETNININNVASVTASCVTATTFNLTVAQITNSPIKSVTFNNSTQQYGGSPIVFTNVEFSATAANQLVEVTFTNNCKKVYPVVVNCCSKENLEVTATPIVGSTAVNISLQTTLNSQISSITINSVNNIIGNFTSVGNVYTGTYTPGATEDDLEITVLTTSGCEYTEVVAIPEQVDATLTLDDTSICSNGSTTLTFSSSVANVPIIISGPNNTTFSGTTDINGDKEFDVNQAGTYELTSYNGVAAAYGITASLAIISAPIITDFTIASGIYGVGDVIPFTITGTPGAVVYIGYYNGTGAASVTLDAITGVAVVNVTATALGTLTVTLTQISLSGCLDDITGQFEETTTIVGKYGTPSVTELTVWSSTIADPIIVASSPEGSIKWYSDPALTNLVYTGTNYQTTGSETLYVRVEGTKASSDVVEVVASEFTLTVVGLTLDGDNTGGNSAAVCSGLDGTIGLQVTITGTSGYTIPVWGTSDFEIEWYPELAGAGTKLNLSNSATQDYGFDSGNNSIKLSLKDPSSPDIDYKPFILTYDFSITENTGCNPCFYLDVDALADSYHVEGEDADIVVTPSGGGGTYNYALKRFGSTIDTITASSNASETFTLSNVSYPANEGVYEIEITDTTTGCKDTTTVDLKIVQFNVTFGDYDCAADTQQVSISGNANLSGIQIGVFVGEVLAGFLQSGAIGYTTSNPFTATIPGGSGNIKVSVNSGSSYNAASKIYAENTVDTNGCEELIFYTPALTPGYVKVIGDINITDCADSDTLVSNVGEFTILSLGTTFTTSVDTGCLYHFSNGQIDDNPSATTTILLEKITYNGTDYPLNIELINGTQDDLLPNASDLIAGAIAQRLDILNIPYGEVKVTTTAITTVAPISGIDVEIAITDIDAAFYTSKIVLRFVTSGGANVAQLVTDGGCTNSTAMTPDVTTEGCTEAQLIADVEAILGKTYVDIATYMTNVETNIQAICPSAEFEYGAPLPGGGNYRLLGECGCIKAIKISYGTGNQFLYPYKCATTSLSFGTITTNLTGCCS